MQAHVERRELNYYYQSRISVERLRKTDAKLLSAVEVATYRIEVRIRKISVFDVGPVAQSV